MIQGKKGTFAEKAVHRIYMKLPVLIQKTITVLAVPLKPLKDHPIGYLHLLYLECIEPRIYAKNFKLRRLRKLLRHAFYNVPYYNRLLGNSNLKQLETLGDVHKIPCLEKGDLKSGMKPIIIMVPKAGVEPARPQGPLDFESSASANSTTSA